MRREKNWVRQFDIDDPQLPPAIKEGAFTSGGYPYERRLDRETYEQELTRLQIELVKLLALATENRIARGGPVRGP